MSSLKVSYLTVLITSPIIDSTAYVLLCVSSQNQLLWTNSAVQYVLRERIFCEAKEQQLFVQYYIKSGPEGRREREKRNGATGTANYLVGSVLYILIVLISGSKCVYFRKLSKNRNTWGWWKMLWKDPVTIREAHLSLLHGGDRCRKRGIHSKRQAEGSWCRAGWHLKEDQNQPHNFFPL